MTKVDSQAQRGKNTISNHIARRLARRGTSLVEFSLVFPLFMLLIFGIIDFTRYAYVQHAITHVARQGIRVGITGTQLLDPPESNNPEDALSRYESIFAGVRREALNSPWLSSALDMETIGRMDSNTVFVEFSPDEGTTWATGAGGHQNLVRVRVRQQFKFVTPMVSRFFSPDGETVTVEVAMSQRNLGNPDSFIEDDGSP